MTDRLEEEIRRVATGAVDAAEAYGQGTDVVDLGPGAGPGIARRRYLAVAGVVVLLVAGVAVGLRTHGAPSRLDTSGTMDPSNWPSCPNDPSATDRPATSNEAAAITALLTQMLPGYEVAWARQGCGHLEVAAMETSATGPSFGAVHVIYAYGAPERQWEADAQLNGLNRDLSGLPDGVIGASNSSPEGSPNHLVVMGVVPAGLSPLFVEIGLAGRAPVGLTDDDVQALAVQILTTVAPPGP